MNEKDYDQRTGRHHDGHDDFDLVVDFTDLQLDAQQVALLEGIGRQLGALKRLVNQRMGEIMAVQEDIQTAVAQVGTDATDAANRVITTINENNAAIEAANATISADNEVIAALQAQIAAGVVTPEAAQAVLDSLASTSAALDAIDTAPVEPI